MQNNCHMSVLIHEQAKKYGEKVALNYRDFGSLKWKTASWNEFSQVVKVVSNALLNLGVKVQENIGVFSQNTVQYLYTDFGAFGIRAVTIPFYATSSEQQVQYIIGDAQIRFLFVGEQEQYDKAHRIFPLCPTLERIIVFDSSVRINPNDPNTIFFDDFLKLGEGLPRQSEVESLYEQANYEDLANILYTSGTTGDSKGVMLTYGQYHAAFAANDKCVPVGEKDRIMNFLPFTHIFERGWMILCLTEGAELIVNTYPKEVQQSMRETHPTCMSSVPRFWEKVLVGVKEKIDNANPVERKLFKTGLYIALPPGYEAQVRPRSGLALKHGITVLNTPGTIDADYRGEVGVLLINLSGEDFIVNDGERIAQMVIARHEQGSFTVVEELDETERGAGGYGHTGVK